MFNAEVDQNAQAALDEARSGGNGKFPPLLKGEYPAHIVPLKTDGSNRIEVAKFGGDGPNGQKNVLRIAVKLDAGIPLGAGRVFFGRVPLFSRYAPTQKNPAGAPARAYFDFWGKVMGLPDEQLLSGQLNVTPEQILARALNVVLSEPTPPDSYNPLGSNEISFFNPSGPVNPPARAAGQILAPWLDADDNLLPSYGADAVQAAQQHVRGGVVTPPAGGSAWGGPSQQDAADAQQQAASAAPPAGGVTPGAWANQPTY